jgi:hypothetical protein
MVASGRSPPVAQALIFHWADVPRGLAACAATTLMHRLTGEVSCTVVALPCEWLPCGCRCFGCPAGLGVAEALGDPEGVAVLPAEPSGLGEGEPVAAGEDFRVLVVVTDGGAVLVGEGFPEVLALADGECGVADGECVSVLVGVADGECVKGLAGVADGECVKVRVGVGLG